MFWNKKNRAEKAPKAKPKPEAPKRDFGGGLRVTHERGDMSPGTRAPKAAAVSTASAPAVTASTGKAARRAKPATPLPHPVSTRKGPGWANKPKGPRAPNNTGAAATPLNTSDPGAMHTSTKFGSAPAVTYLKTDDAESLAAMLK